MGRIIFEYPQTSLQYGLSALREACPWGTASLRWNIICNYVKLTSTVTASVAVSGKGTTSPGMG